jgi:BirA family biotin operon repressor/biotin-[acetyl-CoA-carboxylase] ligase
MYAMNEKILRREYFENIPSTNDYAKEKRSEKQDLLVVANAQSGGRGTKGRSFSSKTGGLYLSLLTFYEDFPSANAFQIMQNAAASVCETLVGLGIQPTIKWPNDIYANGKKICGILIENQFSGNRVASSVVGIGLNICNDLSDVEDIATSVLLCTGKTVSVAETERTLVGFLRAGVADKYQKYLGWIGEEVVLETAIGRLSARVLGVDERGNLIAQTNDGEKTFSAAEVRFAKESL